MVERKRRYKYLSGAIYVERKGRKGDYRVEYKDFYHSVALLGLVPKIFQIEFQAYIFFSPSVAVGRTFIERPIDSPLRSKIHNECLGSSKAEQSVV